MLKFGHIAIDLIAGFVLLFIIAKLLGKTQMSQITTFEFITALVLGELVGNAIFNKEVTLVHTMFALTVWGLLMYISSFVALKLLKARGILEGNPSIIIKQGRMDRQELKRNRMTINQLQIMLRQKDVFSIREVYYAVLEPTGIVTVLKKDEYIQPVKSDFSMPQKDVAFPINIIIDGKLLHDNLAKAGFNENWLYKQLRAQGYEKVEDIFYAEWLEGEGMYIEPLKPSQKGALK